jgi:hypothetical protein
LFPQAVRDGKSRPLWAPKQVLACSGSGHPIRPKDEAGFSFIVREKEFNKSMDARIYRTLGLVVLLLVCMGARHQSANFIVETADPQMAAQIAQAAEKYRNDLSIEWLGQTMPNWAQPCMMTVHVGPNLGAGGATTFVFDHGEVFGWRMTIQGSAERVLDSVLPHEITHMVYASFFRQPLPRWADEGGATSVEHVSEKQKHRTMLVQFLRTGRGIAFNQMFAMTDYPRDVMPLYAEAYSLAEYLIYHGGRRKYIEFLSDALQSGQWSAAVQRHYGISDLGALQNTWVAWVAQGFPEPKESPAAVAASVRVLVTPASADSVAVGRRARPEPNLVYRTRDKALTESTTTSRPMVAVAAQPKSPAAAAPAAKVPDWYPGGPATTATAATNAPAQLPVVEQVTRPQPVEPSQQVIMEWNQRQ